ncbi:MAG: hypothetical protein LC775_05880 [Acidobacteria bacterium]|nr:hypothetical protein [Acidobacteriota bacterium]
MILRQMCSVLSTKYEALLLTELGRSIDELAESKHSIPVLRLVESLLEFLRHSLTADELDRKAFAITSLVFDGSLKVEWCSALHDDSKLSAITAYIDQLRLPQESGRTYRAVK